jgi:plastocyanin
MHRFDSSGLARVRPAGTALARVLGVTALACALIAAAAAPATVGVDIAKFAYGPQAISISPGTKVVWTNHDDTPHTVTSSDRSFASKGLDTDDRFEHTFADEGDFGYICTVHPYMTGVVHVHRQ